MKRKVFVILLCLTMILASACGKAGTETSTADNASGSENSSEPVVIKVFSNQTDRKSGQGLIEQTLFDNYVKENPNVEIKVEALDDEAYKTKFRAYASGSEMPDLVNSWGQPSFLNEVIDAGLLAELNMDDYSDYGFIPGSLDGFSKDGKLYGLPRNTDVMAFYYNKAIFADNGWSVPNTYDELLTLAGDISSTGLIPCSMDGADKWPISVYIHDLIAKLEGSCGELLQTSIETADFSNPSYQKSVELLQQAVNAGLFQSGFETTDYGTAMNLFANGQSAMFYMGSWEMSLATNPDVIPEVKDNIGVFTMPAVEGGSGTAKDIAAWNGGGYSITENSKVKEEVRKLLNYMFLPENWSKLAWEEGVCMSAQDYSQFLSGNETEPQKVFTQIVTEATSITGTTFNDRGTSEFKTIFEDLSQEVSVGIKTPEQFVQELENACK